MSRYILIRRLRGPAILLLIGVLALLHEWHWIPFWRFFWPLLFIVWVGCCWLRGLRWPPMGVIRCIRVAVWVRLRVGNRCAALSWTADFSGTAGSAGLFATHVGGDGSCRARF